MGLSDPYEQPIRWRPGVFIGRHEVQDLHGPCDTCLVYTLLPWGLTWNRPPRGYEDWPKTKRAFACSLECTQAKAATIIAEGDCLMEGDLGT